MLPALSSMTQLTSLSSHSNEPNRQAEQINHSTQHSPDTKMRTWSSDVENSAFLCVQRTKYRHLSHSKIARHIQIQKNHVEPKKKKFSKTGNLKTTPGLYVEAVVVCVFYFYILFVIFFQIFFISIVIARLSHSNCQFVQIQSSGAFFFFFSSSSSSSREIFFTSCARCACRVY